VIEAPTPLLPPGREVDLAGRGRTFVREVEGPPGAPTVLLLHGWTATADLNWFATYGPLGEHFRVVALDHRGHGSGIRSRRPFRLDDCADDAAALIEVLGTGPVIAGGYSMGGPIALLLWRRHRELVSGVVQCATAARFVQSTQGRLRLGALGALGIGARVLPAKLTASATNRVVQNYNARRGRGGWVTSEVLKADGRALLDAGGELARVDIRSWVAEVDIPAAVVVTTRDELVPVSEQLWLAGALDATIHEVNGVHTVCVADPDAFSSMFVEACLSVASQLES
jgi:3-oxoadipate enol-lactonase